MTTDTLGRALAPARPGELSTLSIGPLRVWPPVVLAPMAGVTNHPFRRICRRYGAGLCVSEMVTARPLAMGIEKTARIARFGPGESPRSLQLYGTDPYWVSEAVARLVGEGAVDHLDMNFGCPVPKVTRRGGGAALPAKPRLLASIVRAAVSRAGPVPVTIKFRMGIDDTLLTYLSSGRVAEQEGCAAVALHARTAAQLYDGAARWHAIAELKDAVRTIPVLGNGDVWEATDALRMMRETGCDGVVVGRGCLGRPWLFRDLADVCEGRTIRAAPRLGEVADVMLEHAGGLAAWLGEDAGVRSFRRHATWYTKGFRGSAALRRELVRASTLQDLRAALAPLDREEPFPATAARLSRGKTSGVQRVALPHGYLESLDDDRPPEAGADEATGDGG